MADKDPGNTDGPSLELPSFGFSRKRRGKAQEAEAPASGDATADLGDLTPGAEPLAEPADPAPTAAIPGAAAAAAAAAKEAAEAGGETEPTDGGADSPPAAKWEGFRLPDLPGRQAAAVTGLVVGLLGVGATYLSLSLCQWVKGTSSCGGAGMLLLIGILIGLVIVGAALLRGFRVPDPTSTSFLAVGLLAVIALLFLVEVLLSWTMVLVIPVASVLTYLLSHWVTTEFIEPAREEHDVDR